MNKLYLFLALVAVTVWIIVGSLNSQPPKKPAESQASEWSPAYELEQPKEAKPSDKALEISQPDVTEQDLSRFGLSTTSVVPIGVTAVPKQPVVINEVRN